MIDRQKLKQFQKKDYAELVTNVLGYIDDELEYSHIYDIDPFHYLMDCIEKLLKDESEKGSNKWDIEQYPDPTPFLRKNVWRDICHEMERRGKGGEITNFHNPEEFDDDAIGEDDDRGLSQNSIKPEFNDEWKEMKEVVQEVDEEAWFFMEAMEALLLTNEEAPKRAELAEYLECSADEVTNTHKRIKRRFEEKHKEYKKRRES